MKHQITNTPSEEVQTLRLVVDGTFEFHRNLIISTKSKFFHSLWDWYDASNVRQRSYDPSRLKIDWNELKERHDLTDSIIDDLKRFAFVRLSHSREVFCGDRKAKNAHPATIVNEIQAATLFLSHLRRQTAGEGCNLVQHLSDVNIEDLENALSSYSGRQHLLLKKTLGYLCHPNLSLLLNGGSLKWNKHDLDNLTWTFTDREPYKRVDEDLFRFLSNTATSDIKQFLLAINIQPEDKTSLGTGTNVFLSAFDSFCDFLEEYCTNLNDYRAKRYPNADSRYVTWCRKKKGAVRRMNQLVDRARKAAQSIIAMYTGARLSELNSFTMDCLSHDGDHWLLKGTEIKRRSRWAQVLQDQWIAIPIMRDAIKVLAQTSRIAGSNYLFHPGKSQRANRAMGSADFKHIFGTYLKYVQPESGLSNSDLFLYRFRHTLTFQLRKAGLGLPHLSFQLKHFYDAFDRKLNDVTLIYGTLGSNAAQQAVEDANRIFLEHVYHPDSPVAGGGAEQHKARRAEYFKGMALHGIDAEQELTRLAKQGMPMTDVGVAICSGQRKIVLDGIKQDPPCIGGLRCNPLRCTNGIIPAHKLPAWEKLALENRRRAEDPEFAHARAYHEEAAAEAEGVVRYFQIQGRRKE